jgi:hypothetical protein
MIPLKLSIAQISKAARALFAAWGLFRGNQMRPTLVFSLIFLLAMPGCKSIDSLGCESMSMTTDETAMRLEVLRYVSVAMPIEQAKEIMEKHGFKCSYERDFWEVVANGQICLVCSKYTPESNWISSDLIYAYVLFEAGAVKDIVVRCIKTCL